MDGGFPRVYFCPSNGLIEFRLRRYAAVTSDEDAAELRRRLEELAGHPLGGQWPALSEPERLLGSWARVRDDALIPYVERQRIAS